MKKALASLAAITFLTTNTLAVTACNKDEYLEITNDEIYDQPGSTGKIDNIAFIYIYALPKNEKPDHSIESFHWTWDWNLKNRKEIIGLNHAKNLDNQKTEYWKITIQKTKSKGIFVSNHKKSYDPIK
ncbi:MAG: hypothetical protein ACRC8P_01565 [Spiroplasma sp.]